MRARDVLYWLLRLLPLPSGFIGHFRSYPRKTAFHSRLLLLLNVASVLYVVTNSGRDRDTFPIPTVRVSYVQFNSICLRQSWFMEWIVDDGLALQFWTRQRNDSWTMITDAYSWKIRSHRGLDLVFVPSNFASMQFLLCLWKRILAGFIALPSTNFC